VIAFLNGFAAVFVVLSAWTFAHAFSQQIALVSTGPLWRVAIIIGATLIAAPVAGAWIGMEVMGRLRPIRAFDSRVRRAGWLAAAGVGAGVLSAAASAAAMPFTGDWVPDAVVTGVLSIVLSALMMLPFARRRPDHCIQCGYDLRGGAMRATCPECGAVGSAA
jgi:hypothetical protein